MDSVKLHYTHDTHAVSAETLLYAIGLRDPGVQAKFARNADARATRAPSARRSVGSAVLCARAMATEERLLVAP